jgi:acetyltransferase-like isoleucine patch superfamily enzyme
MLRDLFVQVATLLTLPLWAAARLERRWIGGEEVFRCCAELLSLFPGLPGIFLRRGFYRMTLDAFASDAAIGFGTTVAHRQVRIGRGVYIGNRCTLGRVVIEDDVTIGSNVDILSGRHQHDFSRLDLPIQQQGGAYEQVRIGRNSWIGNSAVIMADIAEDCVLGAGSVVVGPIGPRCIAAGNPATVKRRRGARRYSPPSRPLSASKA